MQRFIARLALLTSLGVVVVFAGQASGAAGDPLLIGETANDAGTHNTKLTTASSGAVLWVAQAGSGVGLRATPGATGGDAVFASTANRASSAVHAVNTAGGPAARFVGSVSVSGLCSGCDARQPFAITALDKTGNVGSWTSITIGRDGLGLISYSDDTKGDLKVAHCSNPACTAATTTSVDHPSSANVGWGTSITIGKDGLGLISYIDYSNDMLKVAHCSNIDCTVAAKASIVDADVFEPTSITIGRAGLGIVAYKDPLGSLKVAHCSNAACSSATTATVDNVTAGSPSIAVDSGGAPMISYESGGDLKWASCGNAPACTSWLPRTLIDYSSTNDASSTSLTTTADGEPVMAFVDEFGTLLTVTCSFACTSSTQSGAEDSSSGDGASITLGSDGAPVFAFFTDRPNPGGGSPERGLGVARCRSDCAEFGDTLADPSGTSLVGQYPAITIGTDGFPLISYYDHAANNLKVVHCTSAFCAPYMRRR